MGFTVFLAPESQNQEKSGLVYPIHSQFGQKTVVRLCPNNNSKHYFCNSLSSYFLPIRKYLTLADSKMNFSTSNGSSSRIHRFQIGSGGGARAGLSLSATTFDYRNNNVTSKILHSIPDKYHGANFPLKISSSSPRVPEIQMINKFYGLIPKKFVINERLRPTPPVIRHKSSTRPKTTKQSSLSRTLEIDEVHRLRRHSSVDESRTGTNGLEPSSIPTPILTRRISFERNFAKQASKAERKAESQNMSSGLSALLNQRVIRIDLNHMRWEEETVLDEHDVALQANEDELPTPKAELKSGILRKTISFDESVLHKTNETEGSGNGGSLCKGHFLQVKERPITARPSVTTQIPAVKTDEQSTTVTWTAGKTTAERRSKFQKTFSVHPSFADASNSIDSWAGESESGSYPESMTKTGRRSFHVEPPPEVDTLMSKGSSENGKPMQRQKSLETACIPTSSPRKSTVAETPINPPKLLTETKPEKVTSSISSLEASERRKLFKKSVSLPVEAHEVKATVKKASTPGLGKGLSRQNSAAVTKAEVNKVSSSTNSSKGKGEKNRVAVIKKTLVELKRLRPKTAPSNNSNHNSTKAKALEPSSQEDYAKRRRQPMKVRSDVSGSGISQSEPRVGQGESKKQVSIMENKGHTPRLKKGSGSKTEPPKAVAAEEEPPPPPVSPLPPPPLARRSFSLDEGSLLTYSTDAAQETDSIENSIQNSKKREECLKIYERMKQGGCAVRLQTIFRGLMTPSEYRIFIAAAEKAAAASLAEAEAAAVAEKIEDKPAAPDLDPTVFDTLGTENTSTQHPP